VSIHRQESEELTSFKNNTIKTLLDMSAGSENQEKNAKEKNRSKENILTGRLNNEII